MRITNPFRKTLSDPAAADSRDYVSTNSPANPPTGRRFSGAKLKSATKKTFTFLFVAAFTGYGAFNLGYSGVNVAQFITSSRCRSGAFIAHTGVLQAVADGQTTSSYSAFPQDDPAYTVSKAAPVSGSNLIPNPGLEAVSGGGPASWSNNRYGANDATFTQVLGYNSNRGVRVDITKYQSGTGDWFTTFVPVTPGGYYVYSDFYRSNVATHPELALKYDTGSVQYGNLTSAPASANWKAYSDRFFVPVGVHQIQVSHPLDRVGSLETDNYSLQAATPSGFNQPLVSITFDDGWASAHDTALPVLKRLHLPSTQYIISGYVGQPKYDTVGDLFDFKAAGTEIAAHTFDHRDLTTVNDTVLTQELKGTQSGLSKCFGSVNDFAYPYGAYDIHTTQAVAGDYQTARSTNPGFNTADQFNPYELKVQNVDLDTKPEEIQGWLDTAKATHTWLILVYHQIDTGGSPYSRKPADFSADMQKVAASGIPVKTMQQAYAIVKPQIGK